MLNEARHDIINNNKSIPCSTTSNDFFEKDKEEIQKSAQLFDFLLCLCDNYSNSSSGISSKSSLAVKVLISSK